MNRDNWFLVLPTALLGLVALYTLHNLYTSGDVRRAVRIVSTYQAEGRLPLGELLAAEGPVAWDATVVSRFYGTMDVTCKVERGQQLVYRWRVGLLEQEFAPADEATRALMREYEPGLYEPSEESR